MDKNTVIKAARLAQIELKENEIDAVKSKMEGIIGFVEQLSEVDTTGVEPLRSVNETVLRLRADVVNDGGIPDKVLKNAPESKEGFFVVSKIIE
jgi:aspartyl-tRNA(Asn)/glutamyl-tRNA(Gln) amidotransferase subunit C|tara:strand:+ start:166 stop:447 length:282 start_codon:yes stop_codon:yes gene_type:complete